MCYLILIISGSGCIGNYHPFDIIIRYALIGYLPLLAHKWAGNAYFVALYIHIGKALIYGSYKHIRTWMAGLLIFYISMGCSFIGYLLPLGIMSFAGLSIISGLLRNIGQLQDEFSFLALVDNLPYLLILHVLSGSCIIIGILVHMRAIHADIGSNLNIGINRITNISIIIWKDLGCWGFIYICGILSLCLFDLYCWINKLPHSFYTPTIIPEWYLLWGYCILRGLNKANYVFISLIMVLIRCCYLSFNLRFKTLLSLL